jgi:Putative MetA-pathway of phenol degradation
VYDNISYGYFDADGRLERQPPEQELGSLTYVNYGLTDRLTIGLIPRFGYDLPSGASFNAEGGVGDTTIQAQYRITNFKSESSLPIFSVNVQETVPTGRYDRLERPTDGFGSGAYMTTVSALFQSYFWLPNGRIIRGRLDASYSVPARVSIVGRSVYDTPLGFEGHADLGNSAAVDAAFEYSVTRRWDLALDLWFERDASTRLIGSNWQANGQTRRFAQTSGVGRELITAPAIEYNWSARMGIIVGLRAIAAGRNEIASVAPVMAFSYFR